MTSLGAPRAACVLCGNVGAKRTVEHIVPKWAATALRARTARPSGRFATHKERSVDPTVHEWVSAEAIEHTVKVCTVCNGAMQRDIEDPVQAIARPLLTQTRIAVPLPPAAQLALARWLTKITLLAPLVGMPPRPLSHPDWDFLRANGHPKDSTHIWIGAYAGGFLFDTVWWESDLAFLSERTGRTMHGRLMTQGLGHLVAQSLIFPQGIGRHLPPEEIAFAPRFADHLMLLWPPRGRDLAWPPTRTFDETSLRWLSKGGAINQRPPGPRVVDPPR